MGKHNKIHVVIIQFEKPIDGIAVTSLLLVQPNINR